MGANIDRANRNKKIKDVNRQNRLLNAKTILKAELFKLLLVLLIFQHFQLISRNLSFHAYRHS
jgi:hypothetical protein